MFFIYSVGTIINNIKNIKTYIDDKQTKKKSNSEKINEE
jgi:hypothetical protein